MFRASGIAATATDVQDPLLASKAEVKDIVFVDASDGQGYDSFIAITGREIIHVSLTGKGVIGRQNFA